MEEDGVEEQDQEEQEDEEAVEPGALAELEEGPEEHRYPLDSRETCKDFNLASQVGDLLLDH